VSEVMAIQEWLSSGADLAMIVFAVLLWKMDRRLLTVELGMKSMWKQFIKEDKVND